MNLNGSIMNRTRCRLLLFAAAGVGTLTSLAAHAAPAAGANRSGGEQGAAADEEAAAVELDVVGHRGYAHQQGAVVGVTTPEVQYTPPQIQALGVNTISELLDDLVPQTRSDRGRTGAAPVVLLNGRRISGLGEVNSLPTEAILRVDILPEETALRYGYAADQRVVNIVLRRNFRAIVVGLEGGATTDGGRPRGQAELGLVRVHRNTRLNLDLKYKGADEVTDADRGIIEGAPATPFAIDGNVVSATPGAEIDLALSALAGRPVTVAGVPAAAQTRAPSLADFVATAGTPNTTDIAGDRTLAPQTHAVTANAVVARPIGGGVNATVNLTLGATRSMALRGLPGVQLLVPAGDPYSPFASDVVVDRYDGSPLRQEIDGWTAHFGSVLNRDAGKWRLSLTDGYTHADTQTYTDAGLDPTALQTALDTLSPGVNPFAPQTTGSLSQRPRRSARVFSDAAQVEVLATGVLANLPAGELFVSVKAGDAGTWLSSRSNHAAAGAADLSRNDGSAQISVDVPLTSRKAHVLPGVGDLLVNANASVDQLSDFGALHAWGLGLSWTPTPGYNLIASFTRDEAAPSLNQLGDPVVATPGVRLFDYVTGRTVEVTRITGGEGGLAAEHRDVLKIGLTVKPLRAQDLSLVVNYINSRATNTAATLPSVAATEEAAFPSRFIRDAAGNLITFDDRPVNFAKSERSEIRWGINFTRHIGERAGGGSTRQALVSAVGDSKDPALAAANAGPTGPNRGGTRVQFALYHTVFLSDRDVLRPAGPTLDLLNGDAASSTGGQPRHEVEAQLGFSRRGAGARITGNWREGTTVRVKGSPGGDLNFSDVTVVNLRLFKNFGQRGTAGWLNPWLHGTRISLNVTNLLDQHVRVRNAMGVTPLAEQAGYLDPVGRTIILGVRKRF